MVEFKFTKKNGIATVGTILKVPENIAKVYKRIGLGHVVEQVKEQPKKGGKTKSK